MFCSIKGGGVRESAIVLRSRGRQPLPQGIVLQVRPEAFESHRCIKLGPGFSSTGQFDLSHFSNHLRDVVARNCLRSRKFRIGAEGSHERPPGKFSGRECTYNAVGRRVESFDIGNMGRHLRLEKSSDLLIEFGSPDLRLVSLHLRERIATLKEKTGKK